ncbi:MAG TPA: DUF3788 family protein [Chitinophagaceae bacterium]|nr:DUF3788 family protein [Chitinophagaceae bacterium]
MDTMILKEPSISPTKGVLENALGKSFGAYEELMSVVTSKYDLVPVWHYYNDGKAWLCKVQYKKKTVFWLSVWKKYFRITFYFTPRNGEAIKKLDIDDGIKKNFAGNHPVGRLLPLSLVINKVQQLKDAIRIIEHKKSLVQ